MDFTNYYNITYPMIRRVEKIMPLKKVVNRNRTHEERFMDAPSEKETIEMHHEYLGRMIDVKA